MDSAITPNLQITTPLLRGLSLTLASAQGALARSKAALSALQDRIASFYFPEDTNYNCFQEDPCRPPADPPSLSPELVPYFQEAPEHCHTEILDTCGHNQAPLSIHRPARIRRTPSTSVMASQYTSEKNKGLESYNNVGFSKDTNICNISGELTNLLKAQQKLLFQIEKLKCEIGEKSGSIDTCLKENQFFNCKFKEIENQINLVKHDIDKIKKDLVMTISRDRCFSPYSPDSYDRSRLLPPTPVTRHTNFRKTSQESHFGYQDVCTPETSIAMSHAPRRQIPSLSMNFKDRNCQSTTFEDLMRKSKLDIDCNINNCRNNQNISNLSRNHVNDHVLKDFISLNNQIRNLRKMAEAMFKSNFNDITVKGNKEVTISSSKNNDITQEDQSRSCKTKPIVETTLSLVSQLQPTEEKNVNKEASSSAESSARNSDTSYCFCTEDQLPVNTTGKTTYNGKCKVSKSHFSPVCNHNKTILSSTKQNPNRCYHRNKERNNYNTITNNCSTLKCASNRHNHLSQIKQICSECKNVVEINRPLANHR